MCGANTYISHMLISLACKVNLKFINFIVVSIVHVDMIYKSMDENSEKEKDKRLLHGSVYIPML